MQIETAGLILLRYKLNCNLIDDGITDVSVFFQHRIFRLKQLASDLFLICHSLLDQREHLIQRRKFCRKLWHRILALRCCFVCMVHGIHHHHRKR